MSQHGKYLDELKHLIITPWSSRQTNLSQRQNCSPWRPRLSVPLCWPGIPKTPLRSLWAIRNALGWEISRWHPLHPFWSTFQGQSIRSYCLQRESRRWTVGREDGTRATLPAPGKCQIHPEATRRGPRLSVNYDLLLSHWPLQCYRKLAISGKRPVLHRGNRPVLCTANNVCPFHSKPSPGIVPHGPYREVESHITPVQLGTRIRFASFPERWGKETLLFPWWVTLRARNLSIKKAFVG